MEEMAKNLTCCQIITSAEQQISQFNYEFQFDSKPYNDVYVQGFNDGINVGQTGLFKLSEENSDPKCCEVAAEGIILVISKYLNIIAQLVCLVKPIDELNTQICFYLTLLKKSIDQVVETSINLKDCCIEVGKQKSLFCFENDIVQAKVEQNKVQLAKFCQVFKTIQKSLDQLYKLKLSFECCLETVDIVIQIQTKFLDFLNQPISATFNKQFGSEDLSIPRGIDVIDDLAYVVGYPVPDIFVFNIKTGNLVSQFGSEVLDVHNAITICGNLAYVVDSGNDVAQVFDINTEEFVTSFGSFPGTTATDITISDGLIYITIAASDDRVEVFDAVTLTQVDSFTSSDLQSPQGIAIQNNKAYVIDSTTDQVVVFDVTPGDNFGTPLPDENFGNLNFASGIAIQGNRALISDENNQNIQIYDINTKLLIDEFGQSQLNEPNAITIYSNNVFIGDQDTGLINVFDLVYDQPNPEIKFFEAVMDQIVDPCQVKNKCCLPPLLGGIYLEYLDFRVNQFTISGQLTRQFTSCVFKELSRLQNNQIKQVDCCEEAFLSILSSYQNTLVKIVQIFSIASDNVNELTFAAGQNSLNQISQIVTILLSDGC